MSFTVTFDTCNASLVNKTPAVNNVIPQNSSLITKIIYLNVFLTFNDLKYLECNYTLASFIIRGSMIR